MEQYLDLCNRILNGGSVRTDRTGTGTMSIFGHQMRFDLAEGFPLVTTKRTAFRLIAHELFWFLRGDTHLDYLVKNDVHIWTPDAHRWHKERHGNMSFEDFKEALKDEDFLEIYGELGDVYGKQWRSWGFGQRIDQIADVINQIKTNPDSRRLIVSAWNPSDLPNMALPPCHVLFQFYVQDGKLSCQLYQRSGDVFLGVPFNIASYALLTHMVAQVCGLKVGEFIHTLGDAHIYLNHIDQVREQLSREPKALPKLLLNPKVGEIDGFTYEDVLLSGYEPHPPIKGDVSVG